MAGEAPIVVEPPERGFGEEDELGTGLSEAEKLRDGDLGRSRADTSTYRRIRGRGSAGGRQQLRRPTNGLHLQGCRSGLRAQASGFRAQPDREARLQGPCVRPAGKGEGSGTWDR